MVEKLKKYLKFIFLEPPKIDRENVLKEISKKIGDSAKLICSEEKAWPRSKITWYFNNNKVKKNFLNYNVF